MSASTSDRPPADAPVAPARAAGGTPAPAGPASAPPAAAVSPPAGTTPPAAPDAPAAGGEQDAGAGSDEHGASGGDTALSREDARKLRSEAQNLRKRLKEFEDAKAAADEAKLSEAERLTKRLQALEAENSRLQAAHLAAVTRAAVESEARKQGFVDDDAAYRLLDADALEYDADTHLPTGASVRAALKKLGEHRPYLLAPAPTAATSNGGAPVAPALGVGSTPRPDNGRALTQAEEERRRDAVYGRARAAF